MGHCCCKEDKTDIPNITVKDMCKDIQCNCASSCCMKQQKKHTHHKHKDKDKDNKDDK